MDILTPECAAQSLGPANQLFGLLVQTILAAQCAISPKDMWPKDYGPTAVEQGNNTNKTTTETIFGISEIISKILLFKPRLIYQSENFLFSETFKCAFV